MQYKDIDTMLEASGLPVTYYSWPEDDPAHPVPPLPYIVWYLPGTENVAADDSVYKIVQTLNIELYTANKDFETEAALEAILDDNELVWDKTETYLSSERMYEVLYTTEVYING